MIRTNDLKKLKEYKHKESYSNYFRREVKKGNLIRVKRGYYVKPENSIYEVSSNLIYPSYNSLFSALNYYKITEQIPNTIQVICTKQKKEIKFNNYNIRFIKVKPKWMFGIKRESNIFIATQEKLILDALKFQNEMGNFDEVIELIKKSEIKKDKIILYLLFANEKSLIKRAGYLFEKYKNVDIYPNFADVLSKDKNYIKLNLYSKSKKISKKWRLFIE